MTRKAITLSTKCAVLQSQALCGCGCGQSLKGEAVEYHHMLAHALEGSDGPENIAAVRADCHDRLSNGTKATTAGSTKHVVAKVKRLAKKTAEESPSQRLSRISMEKHKRKILSLKFPPRPDGYEYRWPKGRKVGG